jgi:hypothetical protein
VTLFRIADNLAIRVGRRGVWIWAPDVSVRPIYLDEKTLTEMGLSLVAPRDGEARSLDEARTPTRSA